MIKRSDKNLVRAIAWKAAVLALLIPVALSVFPFLWVTVTNKDSLNEAEYRNLCDRAYFAGNYGELYHEIYFSRLYGDDFALYREVADATLAYENFLQWRRAEKKDIEGSAEKIELYYNEVLSYAENCKFEENRSVLEKYRKEATELWTQDKLPE